MEQQPFVMEQRRIDSAMLTGPANLGKSLQTSENKAVTEIAESGNYSQNENLVSGLFSALKNDPDLMKLVIRRSELSEDEKARILQIIDKC